MKKVWMIVTEHGGPLTLNIPTGRIGANGQPHVYKFARNASTNVEDEDVAKVTGIQHPDKNGTPRNFLTVAPPTKKLTAEAELRVQVEHLSNIVNKLAADNPELSSELGITSVDDGSAIVGL